MKYAFPSPEFDAVVADVCHGLASAAQLGALNELLRGNPGARDEYILRLELHALLASEPDLFPARTERPSEFPGRLEGTAVVPPLDRAGRDGRSPPAGDGRAKASSRRGARVALSILAFAACLMLVATIGWTLLGRQRGGRKGATSNAVAMLQRVVDARWADGDEPPRIGGSLAPGWLRLKSGLAQVVFYSGARVVIEGPAELVIQSPSEALFRRGRLTAEVPQQAQGFRLATPQLNVSDHGTTFGLQVRDQRTELQVFEGRVDFQLGANAEKQSLLEGAGVVAETSQPPQRIAARRSEFAALFDLRARSVAAEAARCNLWRSAGRSLNQDPSLLVRFDFERAASAEWQLPNVSDTGAGIAAATIVGGEWVEGRWPVKTALDFQSVNDRVRLSVPGDHDSLTLAVWVRIQGLDRQFSSLFMSDGFAAGTLHWLIRKDGVLGLTVIGPEPGKFQIVASPPVISLDQFGQWLHLAVVLDGDSRRVIHYLNGRPVSDKPLKISPPFRIGTAELGNWNARGFPDGDPFLIRNFSGAMDEFCLFRRALTEVELFALFSESKPQPAAAARPR